MSSIALSLSLRSRLLFGGALSAYAVGSFEPELVFDFENEYYRTNSSSSTFDSAITHDRDGNATMHDGTALKWAPHNLLLESEFASGWLSYNATNVNGTITESTSSAPQTIYRVGPSSVETRTLKCKLVPVGRDFAVLSIGPGTAQWASATFDLVNGTVTKSDASGAATLDATSISPDGDGYVCSITVSGIGAKYVYIGASDTGTSTYFSYGLPQFTGNGLVALNASMASLYRSDLGGMVNNPDTGNSYVPTTSAARYLARRGHHVYNGSEWVNEGLLVESEARTNLLTYSQDFTDVSWTKVRVTTLTSPDETGPDGETSAFVVEASETNAAGTWLGGSLSYTATVTHAFSFFVKKQAGVVMLQIAEGADYQRQWFNTDTGSALTRTSSGSTQTFVATNVEDCGDFWRISLVVESSGSSLTYRLYVVDADNSFNVTIGATAIIYGAQLEEGSTPSSYIPTSGSTVTRAAETLTVPAAKLPWPTPNVIGPELVTNGTFDTDSDWTKGTGWTISGGVASIDGTNGTSLTQAVGTIGKVYKFTFDVTSFTSGNIRIKAGSSIPLVFIVGTGSFTAYAVCAGNTDIGLQSSVSNMSIDNISVREIDPLAVSIQMQGRATGDTLTTTRWYLNANNYITQEINTSDFTFEQANAGTVDAVTGGSFTSDVNTSFNFASTHASTLVAAAVGGTALTDNTTPTALADLSSTDIALAYSGGPMILKMVRMWPANITEAGREEASA